MRSKTNFWTLYRTEADRWHLLLNVKDRFVDVAFGGRQKPSFCTGTHSKTFTKTSRPVMADKVTKKDIPPEVLRERRCCKK